MSRHRPTRIHPPRLCATAASAAFTRCWASSSWPRPPPRGCSGPRLPRAGLHLPLRRQRLLQHGRAARRRLRDLRATRGGLAVPQAQLLALTRVAPPVGGGPTACIPDAWRPAVLFDAGRAAIVANVGPLVRPVNKALYQQPGTPLPAQLFSHSDQSVLWQTPRADAPSAPAGADGWPTSSRRQRQPGAVDERVAGRRQRVPGRRQVSPYFMSAQGVEQIEFHPDRRANCGNPGQGWNRRRCLTFNALLDPAMRTLRARLRRKDPAHDGGLRGTARRWPPHPDNDPVFRPFWDALRPAVESGQPRRPAAAGRAAADDRADDPRARPLQMQRQLFFAGWAASTPTTASSTTTRRCCATSRSRCWPSTRCWPRPHRLAAAGHHLHRLRVRPHAVQQRRRHRPRLGWTPPRLRRCGQRRPHLRAHARAWRRHRQSRQRRLGPDHPDPVGRPVRRHAGALVRPAASRARPDLPQPAT
jgi:hypothetical protein